MSVTSAMSVNHRCFRWLQAGVAILLFTTCASAATPPALPPWTSVPPLVVQAVCTKLQSEGLGGRINVVTTTEPIITRESLLGLAAAADQQSKTDPTQLAAAISATTSKLPVNVEVTPETCDLHGVASAHDSRDDELLLQLSPPFVNPFVRRSTGILARLSLGGEAPQWYWIPLGSKNGAWLVSMPMSLAVPH